MVKLKWGMEYEGYLVSVDGYMNLQVMGYGMDLFNSFILHNNTMQDHHLPKVISKQIDKIVEYATKRTDRQ